MTDKNAKIATGVFLSLPALFSYVIASPSSPSTEDEGRDNLIASQPPGERHRANAPRDDKRASNLTDLITQYKSTPLYRWDKS